MSYQQQNNYEHNNMFTSPPRSTTFSSTFNQFSSIPHSHSHHDYSSGYSLDFHHSHLLSPSNSEYNRRANDSRISHLPFSYRQPIMNPHERLLTRTEDNCPSDLSGRTQTKWLKAGRKAQGNQHLLSSLDMFYWPESNYDLPVYVHRQTSEILLQGLIYKISNVHLYTIDTESDKPTRQFPHGEPALIQIQAIYDENFSTVFLIETKHLPHSSTPLFHIIQQLCNKIFSSENLIMAWGEVLKELHPFEQFNLFDISQVKRTLNLQKGFTNYWNSTHPHIPECLAHNQPMGDENASENDDILICLVNSNDLDDDFDPDDITADHNNCICPTENRPYKAKNSIWSLQKAIEKIFSKALDKKMTLNFWSCGLDITLKTGQSAKGKYSRKSLVLYAINDLFAPTNLYFYIKKSQSSSQYSDHSLQLNSIQQCPVRDSPTFIILSDSHLKYFPPITITSTYKQIIKSISGLQWVNPYNPSLCARSLISSQSISTLLSTCNGLLLIIGTNSARTANALQIIQQVDDIIDSIRAQHNHLKPKHKITIALTCPCYKPTSLFPTIDSLSLNINQYNGLLQNLSIQKNFNIMELPVNAQNLHHDGMHIQIEYLPTLYNFIQNYFNNILQYEIKLSKPKHRSRAATTKRNQKKHAKQRQRQRAQSITRPYTRVWQLHDLKNYLQCKNINYSRLPEPQNHKLFIQFNNIIDQQHAENTLTLDEFDEPHYYNWLSNKQ